MNTSHVVTVHVEIERPTTPELAAVPGSFTIDGFTYIERPIEARVSLVNGTRDELEVEWANDAQLDGMTEPETKVAAERAEALWWDAMESEPTDAEVRADYQLTEWKERRYEAAE